MRLPPICKGLARFLDEPGGGFNPRYGMGRLHAAQAVAQGARDWSYETPGTGANGVVEVIHRQQYLRHNYMLVGGNFTSFGGESLSYLVRLDLHYEPGFLDANFNPSVPSPVFSLAVQSDGKILVGMTGSPYLMRLNGDGSTDTTFSASLNAIPYALEVDADGDILVGGSFSGGSGPNYLARLNPDGSFDTSFWPYVNNYVLSIIPTGTSTGRKVIIGGQFTTVYGYTRNRFARVDNNGYCDLSFGTATGSDGTVWTMAQQSDGKILLGGDFTAFEGYGRQRIARATSSGALDSSFNTASGANSSVYSIYLDEDEDLILGGAFTSYKGNTANRVVRAFSDGAWDPYFDVETGANYPVYSILAGNPDHTVVLGGAFTTFNAASQGRITRIHNKFD